jgi:hypothetical protein
VAASGTTIHSDLGGVNYPETGVESLDSVVRRLASCGANSARSSSEMFPETTMVPPGCLRLKVTVATIVLLS